MGVELGVERDDGRTMVYPLGRTRVPWVLWALASVVVVVVVVVAVVVWVAPVGYAVVGTKVGVVDAPWMRCCWCCGASCCRQYRPIH